MKRVVVALNIVCPYCKQEHEPIKKEWDYVSSNEVLNMYCSTCLKMFNVSKRREMDRSLSFTTSTTEMEE